MSLAAIWLWLRHLSPKIVLPLAAIVALGIAYGAVRYYRGAAASAELREAQATAQATVLTNARASDEAALTYTEAANAGLRTKEAKARAKTETALAAHPEWASQPVPADVLGSLREDAPAGPPCGPQQRPAAGLCGNTHAR